MIMVFSPVCHGLPFLAFLVTGTPLFKKEVKKERVRGEENHWTNANFQPFH